MLYMTTLLYLCVYSMRVVYNVITIYNICLYEKGQTTIHKALHRKLKIEQHEPHLQLGVNSGAPDKYADPYPHTPIE